LANTGGFHKIGLLQTTLSDHSITRLEIINRNVRKHFTVNFLAEREIQTKMAGFWEDGDG
jgi:hypothetical protein